MFVTDKKRTLMLLAAVLAVLAAGCASTKISSRLSPDWSGPIDGTLIVVRVAGNWSGDDSVYLGDRIRNDLLSRGVSSDVFASDPLALEAPDIEHEVAASGYEHVLLLDQTTEKTMSQGLLGDSPRGFVFDVRLMRVSDAAIMWRGNLDASGNADSRRTYINSMVGKLMDRLEADRVVPPSTGDVPETRDVKPAADTEQTPR